MEINYIGHSCFFFRSESGTSLLTDPYGDIGFSFPRLKADIVTVSHGHYDHCNVEAVDGAFSLLRKAGKFNVRGIEVCASDSFHDDAHGSKRGKNLIFSFEMDGIRICHLGDLGQKLESSVLKAIGKPDVLLIPVGGHYTIDGIAAAEYVRAVSPAIAIPMHYYVEDLTVDIANESSFLKAVGDKYSVRKELVISKNTLPSETQIIVMERI